MNLKKRDAGVRIRCTLEHYYKAVCYCGHETTARPGEGVVSELEGRKKNLKLTEYTMVGPMLVGLHCSIKRSLSDVSCKNPRVPFLLADTSTISWND